MSRPASKGRKPALSRAGGAAAVQSEAVVLDGVAAGEHGSARDADRADAEVVGLLAHAAAEVVVVSDVGRLVARLLPGAGDARGLAAPRARPGRPAPPRGGGPPRSPRPRAAPSPPGRRSRCRGPVSPRPPARGSGRWTKAPRPTGCCRGSRSAASSFARRPRSRQYTIPASPT